MDRAGRRSRELGRAWSERGYLAMLGAVVARDGYAHVGTGRSTILYSREAALAGIAHTRPWRILARVDAAALQ